MSEITVTKRTKEDGPAVFEGAAPDFRGKGVRIVTDPRGIKVERAVVQTIDECLAGLGDFFHPELGWIRARGKRERDSAEQEKSGRTLEGV
jgi:hypothetical protein